MVYGRHDLGDNVFIEQIPGEVRQEIIDQCPKARSREQLLPPGHTFTHRFFTQSPTGSSIGDLSPDEKQPLIRAIALSRLVKPTAIGYDDTWVRTFYDIQGDQRHSAYVTLLNFNVAFVLPSEVTNTITMADVDEMAQLWPSLTHFLKQEPKYRRIVRACKQFELAHSIHFADIAYPIVHAALESLICTNWKHNRSQVVQRLPALVPFVTADEASTIYETCSDIKHAAAAMLQRGIQEDGSMTEGDSQRVEAANKLRMAVRHLLRRSLRDKAFAEVLATPSLLKKQYPVVDRRGRLLDA